MACQAANLAFIFPSGQEMIVLLVVGVMLFGRRLPEVGRAAAKTVIQLRQGLNKLKDEMDLDESVGELKDQVREVQNTVTSSVEAPRRAIQDPGGALLDLTNESLSVPSLSEIQADVQGSFHEVTNPSGPPEETPETGLGHSTGEAGSEGPAGGS